MSERELRVGDLVQWRDSRFGVERGYGTVARISGNTLTLICCVTDRRLGMRACDERSGYQHAGMVTTAKREVTRVVSPSRLLSDEALL